MSSLYLSAKYATRKNLKPLPIIDTMTNIMKLIDKNPAAITNT